MREISLQAVPNQRVTVSLNGSAWDIEIKCCIQFMAASIWIDGEPVILGQRIVEGGLLIPYRHLAINGNFFIDGNGPASWREFGRSQNLYYIPAGDL
jgi:hypothetical protein